MGSVGVIILHAEAGPSAGPLEAWLAAARRTLADRQQRAFAAAGRRRPASSRGSRTAGRSASSLRDLARPFAGGGLVVLGSGSIPLATAADRRALVAAAGASTGGALTNNRYSSDVIAIACAEVLAGLPDLPSDNALPRWLAEVAGYPVGELTGRRLRFDVDDPLDLVLLRRARPSSPAPRPARRRHVPRRSRAGGRRGRRPRRVGGAARRRPCLERVAGAGSSCGPRPASGP